MLQQCQGGARAPRLKVSAKCPGLQWRHTVTISADYVRVSDSVVVADSNKQFVDTDFGTLYLVARRDSGSRGEAQPVKTLSTPAGLNTLPAGTLRGDTSRTFQANPKTSLRAFFSDWP
jgi:hypothetical protein